MAEPVPLTDEQITDGLTGLDGWARDGDAIAKTFAHAYHECLHLAMYVGAKAREVGHHPDIDIRWQRIRFSITTHDAGDKITVPDLEMAAHIDVIAAGHGAEPVPADG
jgi:4a-hydroxytetrahydrobiopterin dehydratase